MASIDYIVGFYFGKRRYWRHYSEENYQERKYIFLQKQVEFIKNNSHLFNNILFVVNEDIEGEDREIVKETINGTRIQVLYRPNIDYSYGSWQYGLNSLIQLHKESKYAFLVEDDYLPTDDKFLEPFLDKMDDRTIYVCQLYRANHPAISNGLFNTKLAKTKYNGRVYFQLGEGKDYGRCINNQKQFLDNYDMFKKDHIDDTCTSPFLEVYPEFIKMVTFGKPNSYIPLEPIFKS